MTTTLFTKEYVREVLQQTCVPYMRVPLSDEHVQKIYDAFVEIRNSEAVEHAPIADDCQRCGGRGQVLNDGFVLVACPVCGGVSIATKNEAGEEL